MRTKIENRNQIAALSEINEHSFARGRRAMTIVSSVTQRGY
jgi:hypothetical protein